MSGEPAEKTLSNSVLQVKVNCVVAQASGILKYHGARGRAESPLSKGLPSVPPVTQRVKRASPAGVLH